MEHKAKGSFGFTNFLTSQLLSLFSEELIRFALPAFYFLKTGNAYGSSILYCCILAPRILLGPLLAYLSDHFSPLLIFKRVILGQTLLMGILPLIILTFSPSSLLIWGISAFALSILNSIQFGAIQSVLPKLCKDRNLLRANGLITSFESMALFLAPLSAGFLLDMSGFTALCYMASGMNLIALFLQKGKELEFAKRKDSLSLDKNTLTMGWSFIAKNKNLLSNILLTSPVNLLLAITLALLTPFILKSSNDKAHVLGIILSLGTIGQFLGGISCRFLGARLSIKWMLLGGFMIGGGLGLFIMGLSSSAFGLAVGLFFCGFGIALINASNQTFWQIACPDFIRSRAVTARRSINTCLGPIGFMIAIPLATFISPLATQFGNVNSYSLIFILCGLFLLLFGILGVFFKICNAPDISLEAKECVSKKDF